MNARPVKGIPLWAPGSGFKHRAYYVRGLIRQTLDTPFDMVKRALVSPRRFAYSHPLADRTSQNAGTAAPSFTATLLEEATANGTLTPAHEDDIKGAAGVIYTGSSLMNTYSRSRADKVLQPGRTPWVALVVTRLLTTYLANQTVTALKTFILAMVLHPDVYKKAQAEIDRVVGADRLPDWEDRENLPYLDCIVREVLRYVLSAFLVLPRTGVDIGVRWNAPVPLGQL